MNLSRPNSNDSLMTFNRSKNIVPMSGLCSRCIDGCRGNCDLFKSTFRGRELLYPGPFGEITAGADKNYPVDYSHLNILGYAMGAKGLPKSMANSDSAIFPAVNTETEYGRNGKVKMRVPMFTGALGSTEIARKNWEHFAVGAAITGITIVCGENVCGIDPLLELDKRGKVKKAPDMDRRIEAYRKFHEGYGEILVQLNVEDTRLGVAEYIINKHGITTVELKWGQGAKCIGGEIKVGSLKRAIELRKRGYIVTPDPLAPANQQAFKNGAIKEFERHSRMGFIDEETFAREVQRLRKLGFRRITLKTGAYPVRELAMAVKWSSKYGIDLLTIDGAPGGTGMSPWRMMEEWGIPSIYLHSLAYSCCEILSKKREPVPDIAFGGGFSSEDGIFKGLAMGAPYVKAICLGRALMIPGMVGKNIGNWMQKNDLPKTVSQYCRDPKNPRVEEIFVTYSELKEKYGKDIKNIPLGAIGIYTAVQKIKIGLQQLMAGSRNFRLDTISRRDLISLTREAEEVTGISYVTGAYLNEALEIL